MPTCLRHLALQKAHEKLPNGANTLIMSRAGCVNKKILPFLSLQMSVNLPKKKLQNSNETKLVALKVELSSQWHLEFLSKKSQSQMESFLMTFVYIICIHFEMYPTYSRL